MGAAVLPTLFSAIVSEKGRKSSERKADARIERAEEKAVAQETQAKEVEKGMKISQIMAVDAKRRKQQEESVGSASSILTRPD